MLPDPIIEDYTRLLLGTDADAKRQLIETIRSQIRTGHNQLVPIQIAIVARRLYGLEAAVALADGFLTEPGVRRLLLREIGVYLAHAGEPERALHYLAPGVDEGLFNGDDMLFTADQYARLGRRAEALALIDKVASGSPELRAAADIHAQFHDFLWQFDRPAAQQMFAKLQGLFGKAEVAKIERDIALALEQKQPYLLLRLGDGEGSYIKIDADDEFRYRDLYRANRLEFIDIWFQDEGVLDDPHFSAAVDLFNAAPASADYIGCIGSPSDLQYQYELGSRRGIAALVNIMRGLIASAQMQPDWAGRTGLGAITVHYELLLSGALKRLLQGRTEVGLISCHEALPDALNRTYGISHVEFYKVPGEQIHRDTLGKASLEGCHWPDRFREICEALDKPEDRRGRLFLVAAGLLGKIYAAKLKKSGAVVLDIGAAADLWMGKITRTFPTVPEDLRLDLGTSPLVLADPLVLVDVGGLGGLGAEWAGHMAEISAVVFEPNPAEVAAVRASIAGSPGSMVLSYALSSKQERRLLNVTKSLGCTSLLQPNFDVLRRYSIAPAFRITHTVEVDCVRYDDLVNSGQAPLPGALKIDVQGFEYEVLEGFGETLRACLAVKTECHLYPIYVGQRLFHDIVSLLAEFGLFLRRVSPVDHFDGELVEVDAYFTRNSSEVGNMGAPKTDYLRLIEQVWELPPHTRNFGPDQFA